MFTETWLNPGISSTEIFDKRYEVYRRDRDCTRSSKMDGGGVSIAVSRNLPSARMERWETNCEDLWVSVQIKMGTLTTDIAVCAIYLPPPAKLETLSCFLNGVDYVISQMKNVIAVGDFNLGSIDWSRGADLNNQMFPSNYNNALGTAFVDFMSLNNLKQLNNISNIDGRYLDLVLSNIAGVEVSEPLDLLTKLDSRHPHLLVKLHGCNTSFLKPKGRSDFNFFKANYSEICADLDCLDWVTMFDYCGDVDEMVATLYKELNKIIEKSVPKYIPKSSKYPKWFSRSLIRLLSEKDKLRKKYRKYGNPRDKLEYD